MFSFEDCLKRQKMAIVVISTLTVNIHDNICNLQSLEVWSGAKKHIMAIPFIFSLCVACTFTQGNPSIDSKCIVLVILYVYFQNSL